jgi:phosphohistidine swiveling domain-containing protein
VTHSLILSFDAALSLATAGGKGENLAHMARAGFPVPPGFVVATAAYDEFVAANGLRESIAAALRDLPADDPRALEAVSAAIRARFAAARLPPDLAAAISSAYVALGQPPVAVRSSATAEDLPGLSFAGQQDTYLNVVGSDALCQAVVDCWSSLWTARAIGYRARNAISQQGLSLAVIVQEMVPSETAGVLFTANPLTGLRTETVVDATFGLGEALVSGLVEPDRYVVSAGGRIVSKTLGRKALAIRAQEGGGTVKSSLDAAGRQALPDGAILELARLGQRLSAEFGAPQDIEWAGVDGQFYLLQARPITTLYPTPQGLPAEPLVAMLSFGAVQGMLDPMTPLGRDAISAAIAGAASLFGYHFTSQTQVTVKEAGERLWMDITGLLRNRVGRRVALGALGMIEPGVVPALKELIQEDAWPSPGLPRARALLRLLRAGVPVAVRAVCTLLRPDAEREKLFRWLEEAVSHAQAQRAAASTLSERAALAWRMAGSLFGKLLPRFVSRFGVGMASLNLLRVLAARAPGGEYDVLLMSRGLPYNVTTEMDLALWQAARAIRDRPQATAHIRAADAGQLAADYMRGTLPEPAQSAIRAFLQRYGVRGLAEIDLGRPRWGEDPTPIVRAVQSYLEIASPDQAPDAVFERGREAAEAEVARLAEAMRRTRGGWIKARLVRWVARRMRALSGLRESPKFMAVRILAVTRAMLLESGEELVRAGVLDRADDLFFLHLAELEQGDSGNWADLVRERHRVYDRERLRKQIPRLLLSDGRALYAGIAASSGQDGHNTLRGSPVSPGVAEGVAHVVFDPRQAELAPGEILVCPGTDPSWTPLFMAAGGLVMEVGGLMTHGSVVAREYGIPAVVGVHEATQQIQTGQRIRVDGTSGQIELLG